jgi:arylsulfatase
MISLRTLSALAALLLPTAFIPTPPAAKPTPPNVVLIFMDDLGYGDLSCYGALGHTTPNLDRMAAEGTRFTNFLAAQAVCSASRAGLLTGCYPNRVGISGALSPAATTGLHPDEETLAELLRERGYATGIFGKWHLGSRPEFLPTNQGFDEYLGLPYSNDMWPVWYDGTPTTQQPKGQYPPLPLLEGTRYGGTRYGGTRVVDTLTSLTDQDQLTTRLTERAVAFIEKNKKKPFFLYLPHPMPHVPLGVSAKFRGKSEDGLYGDVIQEIDWSVGQILAALKKHGLDQNTLVLFSSDNGPWFNFGEHAGTTGGLREGKGTSYEGGHRVPFLVRWPGRVPAGRVVNQLLSAIDVLPTVANLCGTRVPQRKIDGLDASALLTGQSDVSPRKQFWYYYRKNHLEAVRAGNWKLVFAHPGRTYEGQASGHGGFPGKSPENYPIPAGLYDLRRDPAERYDVAAEYPERVAALEKMAEAARTELGDELTQRTGTAVRPAGTGKGEAVGGK